VSSLAKTKSVIVLEDLHVKGMQRNQSLALSISDAGMGELRRQLTYKSDWYGAQLVIADRFNPPSRTCSGCRVIKDTLSLLRGSSTAMPAGSRSTGTRTRRSTCAGSASRSYRRVSGK